MGALAIARETADAAMMEQVIVAGDLTSMQPAQRVMYYRRVCESLGLNPLTKPFDYIRLNGKLVLYARKDATEQLRKLNRVSVTRLEQTTAEGVYVVTAYAQTGDGRTDSDIGAVSIQGLTGEAKANAMMKAITKAKRRVTLSICGLGWLDETEVDTIPDARPVTVNTETGEIAEPFAAPKAEDAPPPPPAANRGEPPPSRPADLLAVVNGRVEVPYDNLPHLWQTLRNEYNDPRWQWPQPRDLDGWRDAYARAVAHAQRKAFPSTPPAPSPAATEGDAESEQGF